MDDDAAFGLVPAERTPLELEYLASLGPDELASWQALEQRLRGIGGVRVVCVPDEDLDAVLRDGAHVVPRDMRLVPGAPSRCHENAAALARDGHGRLWTGYALSDDGLWRQHSWVMAGGGVLIETTELRDAYYGVST